MDQSLPKSLTKPLWRACALIFLAASALVFWGLYVPLATTIRLNGTIVSSAATLEMQHPYGGQIAEVAIGTHDAVAPGGLLLRLETELEESNLATYRALDAQLKRENRVISAILTRRLETLSAKEQSHGAQYILRSKQASAQRDLRQKTAQNLDLQLDAVTQKIAQHEAQIAQLEARFTRHETLLERGIISRDNGEALAERIMIVAGEKASEEARRAGIIDQRDQQARQAELIALSLRQELTETRQRNQKQMRELALQIRQTEDVIEKATVRAPIEGVVTNLVFQAQGMYAGRGQTLLSLAQPLQEPYLRFTIPTHLIDQIRPGMTGRFTLLALNQRSLPRLDLRITAISPRAQTDETETPSGYIGRADIDPSAFGTLQDALGEDISLSEDMPVELLIEGRKISAAQYFLEPLSAAFDRAIQD